MGQTVPIRGTLRFGPGSIKREMRQIPPNASL
jgi:hypothetical protein